MAIINEVSDAKKIAIFVYLYKLFFVVAHF